ncbi:hypothetical protein [Salinarimonas ramus]|uniref:DUF4136 domain-containing protein n=1 Tax=Salinarimonas ramus TaxID=690164 RepID=A0A917Q496_9HYPH|nr:hypothetical protein [Salinarimonas ramus]GGK19526.1 hypothetical protein GCM10011322_02810 [Salinarimonas ramus]
MRTGMKRGTHPLATLVAAFALLVGMLVLPAAAQPAPAIGEIRVDVSPLRAKGVGNYADLLQERLSRALEATFADRRARGGARLVVTLESFLLTGYGSGESDDRLFGFGFPGGGSLSADELSGTATLTAGGQVIAREPLRVALPPDQAGPWYSESFELRRAANLADAYASWLARRL